MKKLLCVGWRLRAGVCALAVSCLAGFASAAIKEVEWIEFTGSQWINTHYIPSCTDTFEMKVQLGSTNTTMTLWCSRGSATTEKTMTCFAINPGVLRFDRNANCGKSSPNNAVTTGQDYTVIANYDTLSAKIGDVEVGPMASGDFTPNGLLTIGASHTGYTTMGNYAKIRVYFFKVTDKGGNVVREFVPAMDTDKDEYGVFEKQQKLFFPGLGASPLSGPEVAAEATEFTEEGIGWNVINVAADATKTLTAADVAAFDAAKPLVKLGPGTVSVGAEMADFAGDILIRDGVYKATNKASFGTTAGKTYVNGGTLQSTVGAANTWTSSGGNAAYGEERFYLKGEGYNRLGALRQTNSGCSNFAGQGLVTYEGSVRITGSVNLEFRYGNIYLNSCKTTVAMNSGNTFRFVSVGVDGCGDVEVESGTFGLEAGTGNPSATSTITVNDKTTFGLNNTTSTDKRKLVFKAGSKMSIGQQAANIEAEGALTEKNAWAGQITLESTTPLTFSARAKPLQISGKVTGNGGFSATGGGYLKMSNSANDFKGGLSFQGVVGPGDLNVTGGVSIVGGAAAAQPPEGIIPKNGGPIALKNARLTIVDDRKLSLPDLAVEGRCIVTGAAMAAYKSYVQKGNDVVTMFGPHQILGAADIQSGTLRFGTRVQLAGLNWYYRFGNSGSHQTTGVPTNIGLEFMGVDPTGGRYAYSAWKTTSGSDGASTHTQCHYYTGYIKVPGEAGTSVACNFIGSVCRNVSVVLDGKTYMVKVSDNKDDLTGRTLNYKRCVVGPKVTLTAGWHSILIYMGNHWNGSCGPCDCDNPVWPKNFGIGVDWQGRCEAVAGNYVKLVDPGDGSFLRPYLNDGDKATVDPKGYRPNFQGAVGFGQGAVLDVNDTAPYTPVTISELKGMPTIRNGEVKVTGTTWTLRASDFVDGGAGLTVADGAKLTFAPGTTVAFEGDFSVLAHKKTNRTRSILNAAGGTIVNAPRLSGWIPGTDWFLSTDSDGNITMSYNKGSLILLR